MTTNTSAAAARSASASFSPNSSGCITEIPRVCAQSFTGGAETSMPRPRTVSGVVTTSDGTSPFVSSTLRKSHARAGVPKNTKRTSLMFFRFFVIHVCCLVGIKNAVEMVHLMLEHMRQKSRRSACELLAVLIVRLQHDLFRTRDDTPFAADGKTTLMLLLLGPRYFEKHGVDVHLVRNRGPFNLLLRLVRGIAGVARESTAGDYKKTHRFSDLGRRERHPVLLFREKRLHLCDEFLDGCACDVGNRYLTRDLPQGGVIICGQNCPHQENYIGKCTITL